ncbi:hypothetical protein [Aliiglaciecola lipolytica]|uniref:Lipoprotein n=1 Tax=Aliiglaciecola lipolytica E3 TaxID=1127673 RepID=K6YRD3_9ALTE|nr:hypothetical protein [Aliiglaciecola lipolytica]GAC13850.1 hypothetical protein GLIP_1209 [Aliiglaciecola lipolytica E3]
MKLFVAFFLLLSLSGCSTLYVDHVPGEQIKIQDKSKAQLSGFSVNGLATLWIQGPTKNAVLTQVKWDNDSRSYHVLHYNVVLSVLNNRCYASIYDFAIKGEPRGPFKLLRIAGHQGDDGYLIFALAANNDSSSENAINKHIEKGYLKKTFKTEKGYQSRLNKAELESYLNAEGVKLFGRLSKDSYDMADSAYRLDGNIFGSGEALDQLQYFLKNCNY